jgi:peptidoglycan/LPS O-acetylase OafA/YrhL
MQVGARNKPHTLSRTNPKGDVDEVLCWFGWVRTRWTNWARWTSGSTPEAALSRAGEPRRMEQPFAVKRTRRLQELDSLRGLASLTVVWHHWIWIFRDAVVPWYILPFVSGHEAVILFFVLSGFVLSLGLPVTSPAQYIAFALRRIGRIYLPFVAAVALSGVGCVLFLGRSLPLADWYYTTWHEPVTLAIVLKELTLSPTLTLNPSLWSLGYEMVISLLFPSSGGR